MPEWESKVEGKVVIVTGASSGIGETTARLLAKHGRVVLGEPRRIDRLEKLVGEIEAAGGQAPRPGRRRHQACGGQGPRRRTAERFR